MPTNVKVYEYVDHGPGEESFQIKRMADVYDMHIGQPDEPHRHNYYTVIILREGKGVHHIDFHSYPLGKREVHFVSPGQVHQVVESARPNGFVLTFSERFLAFNQIDPEFISRINLFREYGDSPPLELDDNDFRRVEAYCKDMMEICLTDGQFNYEALGAYLKLILIACNQACDQSFKSHPQQYQAGLVILNDFKTMVAKAYQKEHSVGYYADRLMVSADHLNKTIKSLTGFTAKEYIARRIIVEAKRLLSFTSMSAKEIGYALGFNDPAHFSAFFKRETGRTASAFRKG